ncbi:hypothetical protein Malapachy_0040 [Malassezia pachydermatis]|uniref:Uncharacterized protein n=1 Tax=Malassezia pachydermatis TaxID=77020 RepID=A0A0M9VNF8_9BASI|nr:hypothetical protein Malapachy_0040 [Malassezia pachydermatis]KOS13299.1 hypothetical protein Malapachy_0040 [Malassezia pachydermatis]
MAPLGTTLLRPPVADPAFGHMFATSPVLDTGKELLTDHHHDVWDRKDRLPEPPIIEQPFHMVHILRMAQTKATKMSSVKPIQQLGRQHGSIRIKAESMPVNEQEAEVLETSSSVAESTEVPLCTKIARTRSMKSTPPRRKPAPKLDEDMLEGQHATLSLAPEQKTAPVPPQLPKKSQERSLTKAIQPFPYLQNGLIPIVPPPRPSKNPLRSKTLRPWASERELSKSYDAMAHTSMDQVWAHVSHTLSRKSDVDDTDTDLPALESDHETASTHSSEGHNLVR